MTAVGVSHLGHCHDLLGVIVKSLIWVSMTIVLSFGMDSNAQEADVNVLEVEHLINALKAEGKNFS